MIKHVQDMTVSRDKKIKPLLKKLRAEGDRLEKLLDGDDDCVKRLAKKMLEELSKDD